MVVLIAVTGALSCVYAPLQAKLNGLPGKFKKTRNAFRMLFFIFLFSYLLQAVAFIFIMTGTCPVTSYAIIFITACLDLVPIHCVLYLHRHSDLDDEDERRRTQGP